MAERTRCPSRMAIVDDAATGEFACTEPPGHDGDHQSQAFHQVRWPRLEQAWGTPILTPDAASQRVLALADELAGDAERAYQRSCGHRDEGSEGQYRAYEDAAERIRAAVTGPQAP